MESTEKRDFPKEGRDYSQVKESEDETQSDTVAPQADTVAPQESFQKLPQNHSQCTVASGHTVASGFVGQDVSEPPEFWSSALSQIKSELDEQIFQSFIAPRSFRFFKKDSKEFGLTAPSRLIANHVSDKFKPRLEQLISEYSGGDAQRVRIQVGPVVVASPRGQDSYSSEPYTSDSYSTDSYGRSKSYSSNGQVPITNLSQLSTQLKPRESSHGTRRIQGNEPREGISEGSAFLQREHGERERSEREHNQIGQNQTAKKVKRSAYTETIDTKRGGQYVVVKKLRSKNARSSSPGYNSYSNSYGGNSNRGFDRFSSDAPNNLNTKYTFSNFVVGSNNQFCHAAAMHVAEQPGTDYNPLFIYGGVGLGKTHLMHAIGNAVLQHKPNARVLYMSSETFTNELIQSLRFAKMDEFKNRLRNIDLLLIDDIQFMCGKERTQEEFFHTFNALYNAKSQIVITSDKVPQDIPGIEERLKTRFSWGLTADLQAPDFETRVAIVRRKATIESVSLPEKVAHLIAEKISSNVRELEGALTRLHAVASLQGVPITIEMANEALKPLIQKKKVHVTVDEIKRSVADYFSIKVSEMVSKRRTKNLSYPRHIAMYLCRKHTTCSYPEIGGHFGGRDHSSVIHAANVVNTKLRSSTELQGHVREIESELLNG